MRRLILAIATILSMATIASAADDILRLRSGKIVVGEIVALDDKGVTLKTESGSAKYDWASLTPLCEYEVREERLEPEDADGRVRLAELCLKNGLYPYARRELDTARGLGFADTKRLDALVSEVNEAEADEAFGRIDQLVAQEDYDKALAEIRRFVKDAPESAHTKRAKAMAADVIRRKENQRLREEEEAKEAAEEAKAEALSARLKKYLATAAKERESADTSFTAAVRDHQLSKTSRAEKSYLAAEKHLMKAHHALRKVQKMSRRGVTYDKALEDQDKIKKKLVEVYLGLARLKIEHRNYKRGIVYVNRALYLDPVNEEALALRKEVDENRIRRSARSLTNTPSVRTSGGAGSGK
ncbi:MAG: hypothetical protein ACYTDY_09455 [Planctomycetota bacterium]|jgi:tetratricopeptide (TPR) repeat protein